MSITAESHPIQASQAASGRLMALTQSEKLNLGCGPNAPSTWLNVDGSWNAWFSNHQPPRKALETLGLINKTNQGPKWNVRPLVHDLRKPLPFKDNTFCAVYASHVLEHLFRADAQQLLGECQRVLRAGGVIRLVVPDLYSMVVDYLQRKNSEKNSERTTAADLLIDRLGFRCPDPPDGNAIYKFYKVWKDFHSHKWVYDSDSLIRSLERAGFHEVSEKGFLVSDIPGIEEIEEPGRVLDGAGTCIEGKKP